MLKLELPKKKKLFKNKTFSNVFNEYLDATNKLGPRGHCILKDALGIS